ncbi:hypothetical protein GUITHDRAFT_110176 [Guillardia theta CCMP2712]|uniref:Uncharacterized protein n=1 Tax=Guillardia theta (strain CCMP2712) TaxID=905079 RepID=L1J5A4_GUITC|nr:hypothetical protein GUITHDRAFT_110176 [Guillardia theta CCMP2712]EKX43723.1 hypothetical protein GUITHDRAFT_110176 [Guillardia theta CCMP2712]|eukprot:XP_005830703.1 hypothetical protein GUITHDRAFT_110176 [Guillardia theta CCMP2712]
MDYCNKSCPSYQVSQAQQLQVDSSVGTTIVCNCKCPLGSSDPNCADPNQVPIQTSYNLSTDSAQNTILTVIKASGVYNFIVKGMKESSKSSNALFVGSSDTGFSGLLDASLSYFESLGLTNCTFDGQGVCQATSQSPTARRRLLSREKSSSQSYNLRAQTPTSSFQGVASPVLCIKAGNGVVWSVSSNNISSHYPVYNVNSLLNTNPAFDYGPFLQLATQLQNGLVIDSFFYNFQDPGIYVFHDASDVSKRMVVGVVNPVLDCPAAFGSGNVIQPLSASLIQSFPSSAPSMMTSPNYNLIIALAVSFGSVLLFSVVIVLLRNRVGWGITNSKGPAHRKLKLNLGSQRDNVKAVRSTAVLDELHKRDDGYIDLEGFNVQMLFDKLQDQTLLVTEQLTQQKNDVREFYDKLSRETLSLKTVMNINSTSKESNHEQVQKALNRKERIFSEIQRRKEIGEHTKSMCQTALKTLESYVQPDINFFNTSALSLKEAIDLIRKKCRNQGSSDDLHRIQRVVNETKTVVQRWKSAGGISKEFGLGAKLLDGKRKVLNKVDLIDSSGRFKRLDGILQLDSLTGLTVPCRGTEMQVAKHVVPVPDDCFVHPATGHVLPIEGNLVYNVSEGKLELVSNVSIEGLMERPMFYIRNKQNAEGDSYPSKKAPYTNLLPANNFSPPSNKKRSMLDPFTGLEVAILGVTHDLETGELVAVGGSMPDAVTGILKPISLYGIMQGVHSTAPILITGVKIDERTVVPVPVGGWYDVMCCEDDFLTCCRRLDKDPSEQGKPIFLGAAFNDEFSGLKRHCTMSLPDPLNRSCVIPYQSDLLFHLKLNHHKLVESLLQQTEHLSHVLQQKSKNDPQEIEGLLRKLNETDHKYHKIRDVLLGEMNGPCQSLNVCIASMKALAEDGGQRGRFFDPYLSEELPILLGCKMYDERLEDEVIAFELRDDGQTDEAEVGGCRTLDPVTGKVSTVSIGGRMRDIKTGRILPVTHITRDVSTKEVVPDSNLRIFAKEKSYKAENGASMELISELLQNLLSSNSNGQLLQELVHNAKQLSPTRGKNVQFDHSVPHSPELDGLDHLYEMAADDMHELMTANELETAPTFEEKLDEIIADVRANSDESLHGEMVENKAKALQEMEGYSSLLDSLSQEILQELDAANVGGSQKDNERIAEIISSLLHHEKQRQMSAYERLALSAFEKAARRRSNQDLEARNLEELESNGENVLFEKAALRIQQDHDQELARTTAEIAKENIEKRSRELAQEQKHLQQALMSLGPITDEQVQLLLAEYDKTADRLEGVSRNELIKQTFDVENKLDSAKGRKLARLLEKSVQPAAQESRWKAKLDEADDIELADILEKHDYLRTRLENALKTYEESEKKMFERQVDEENRRSEMELESRFLSALDQSVDEEEKQRILTRYTTDLTDLKQKLETDKRKQMMDFENRLQQKRKKKLEEEYLAKMNQEVDMLKSNAPRGEALKLGLEIENAVYQEIENARLASALLSQDEADLESLRQGLKSTEEAQVSELMINLSKEVQDADAETRNKLIANHELNMARLKAELVISRGREEEALEKKIQARRQKRQKALEDQHREEKKAMEEKDLQEALKEIERIKAISTHAIRQEEQRAKEHLDMLNRAQAEIKLLREELDSKSNMSISAEERRFEDKLNAQNLSKEERDLMIRKHEDEIGHMKALLKMDAAKQIASLESKLQARKAKKQKTLESMHEQETSKVEREFSSISASINEAEARGEHEVEAEMEKEIQGQMKTLSEKIDHQRNLMVEEENSKFEDQLKSAEYSGITDADREQLIQQHQQNVSKLTAYMEMEKNKKEQELKDRLQERKQKRLQKLELEKQRKQQEEEIDRQQKEEMAELERKHEEEMKLEMEKVEMELQVEREREQQKLAREMLLSSEFSDSKQKMEESSTEREKLMEDAEEKMNFMKSRMEVEKEKQEKLLQERLEKKAKKKREEIARRQAKQKEEKLLEQIQSAETILYQDDQWKSIEEEEKGVVPQAMTEEFEKMLQAEKEKIEQEMKKTMEEQQRMREELKKKQEDERRLLEEEMKRDQEIFEENLRKEQEKKAAELEARKRTMQEEMEKMAENVTAEERALLIKKHEEQIHQLEQENINKRAMVDEELQSKLAKRRNKKKMIQEKKQQEEIAQLQETNVQRAKMMKKQMREKEIEALKKMVKDGNEAEALQILSKSQSDELEEVKLQQSAECARQLAACETQELADKLEAELKLKHDNELSDIKAEHQSQQSALLGDAPPSGSGSMNKINEIEVRAEQLRQEKEELKARIEEEIKRMEVEHEKQMQEELAVFENKRKQLASRAADRRKQMESRISSAASMGQQTREDVQKTFEEERNALDSALSEEQRRQDEWLKQMLKHRTQAKQDAMRGKYSEQLNKYEEVIQSLMDRVGKEEMNFRSQMSKEEADNAWKVVSVAKWTMASKLNRPEVKAANKWLRKTFNRSLRMMYPNINPNYLNALQSTSKVDLRGSRSAWSLRENSPRKEPSGSRPSSALRSPHDTSPDTPALQLQLRRQQSEIERLKRAVEDQKAGGEQPSSEVNRFKMARSESAYGPSKEEVVALLKEWESPILPKLEEVERLLRLVLEEKYATPLK